MFISIFCVTYLSYDMYLSTCLKIVNQAMRADTNTNINLDNI